MRGVAGIGLVPISTRADQLRRRGEPRSRSRHRLTREQARTRRPGLICNPDRSAQPMQPGHFAVVRTQPSRSTRPASSSTAPPKAHARSTRHSYR
jgi:hypothetical protein